jgi:succinate-acetate transporter protein
MEHKVEHLDNNNKVESADGAALSRSVTVTMSNEAYERLFFQPAPPRHGDASKRFGNPTLLGLFCFLIPYTSTMCILLQFNGADPPTSLIGLTGDYYFIGTIGMILAGLAEFVLGNTYPFVVFTIFGVHWGSLAYAQDPFYSLNSAFAKLGGASGAAWNSSQAFHNIGMAVLCFVLWIGSIRINLWFVLVFFSLVMMFSFSAAADMAVPNAKTTAEAEHILKLLKFAGGFGFIALVCGWYLTIITVCEAVGIPCPLPVFDLSSKIFPTKKTPEVEDSV